jgi:hypothetical protein
VLIPQVVEVVSSLSICSYAEVVPKHALHDNWCAAVACTSQASNILLLLLLE